MRIMALYRDRIDAGKRLAEKLSEYAVREDVIVLALPRGGVPVGFEVAKALNVPLDIFLVRKLGTPGHKELAMGAIAQGGVRVLNPDVIRYYDISDEEIESVVLDENRELDRRLIKYRGHRPMPDMRGRCVILVDDGLATGASMRAAIQSLRFLDPARIVAAVPTAAPDTCSAFESEVDEIVCAETPYPFSAVGMWYDDFSQTTDEEVKNYLDRAAKTLPPI
jgi:predicted phosphoribosyltransferase